jgi:acetyl esterase/lipase
MKTFPSAHGPATLALSSHPRSLHPHTKPLAVRVGLALLSTALFTPTLTPSAHAQAQQVTLPLWPHSAPEPPQTTGPETDTTTPTDGFISGHRVVRLTNVAIPTLTVYPPRNQNTGAAVLVFPGGAYRILVTDGEGTDACHWLNSIGITCILVKYRVPQPQGEPGHYPADPSDLEDAQQAMRLTRAHAEEWHINPAHIGVMGFSAGANLAVLLSTHPNDDHVQSTPAAPDVDAHLSARANFAILVYPAYLAVPPDNTTLNPVYAPNEFTPSTFLIQAENDRGYGKNALVYYGALMDAHIPAELHYYATGGHGFGMHPPNAPEENWPRLATNWLRSINILPPKDEHHLNAGPSGTPTPCQEPPPPTPGRAANTPSTNSLPSSNTTANPAATVTPNPNCWSTQP